MPSRLHGWFPWSRQSLDGSSSMMAQFYHRIDNVDNVLQLMLIVFWLSQTISLRPGSGIPLEPCHAVLGEGAVKGSFNSGPNLSNGWGFWMKYPHRNSTSWRWTDTRPHVPSGHENVCWACSRWRRSSTQPPIWLLKNIGISIRNLRTIGIILYMKNIGQ